MDGLVQDYSISSANAMEILQSCLGKNMFNFVGNTVPADVLALTRAEFEYK